MHRATIQLNTQSLRIREFQAEDFQALYELTRQPEITDILPDWNMSPEQLEQFMAFVIGSYETFNPEDVRILLAVEHAEDRKLIGWCGVFPNDKLPPEKREVAYAMSKDYRGRGYMTEAVKAVLTYVFARSSLEQIIAIVKPFNQASRKVAEKAGLACRERVQLADGGMYDYLVIARKKGYRNYS